MQILMMKDKKESKKMKYYPTKSFVVTPREMIEIVEKDSRQ